MLQREIDPEPGRRHRQVRGPARALPRRRARRGRLPGLPPEQRHLRPAPGRPQPDGAGQGPLRRRSPPSSSTCSATSPTTYSPRLGPHHHPPEHPVPLRAARAGARRAARPRRRSASPPARRAATPSATCRAATSPAPARTRCSTSAPWAEAAFRHFLRNPLAQRLPRKFKINFSGCATDCGQAMFNDVGVDRHHAARSTTAPSRPASGCSSPAASAPTRTPRWPSRSSPPREDLLPTHRGRSCGSSTTTATATTSSGPA